MKKGVSILSLFVVSVVSNLNAQSKQLENHKNSVDRMKSQTEMEKKNSKVRFGLKAGLNLSNISEDKTEFKYKSKVGFMFGGLVQIPVSGKFYIQPELVYSMEGSDASIDDGTKLKMKMNYLNIPIILKYNVYNKLFVEAGPQIGFLMTSKITANYPEESIFETGLEFDDKEVKNSINLSIGVGASYDWTSNISTGIRYNYGVSNVYKKGHQIIDSDEYYGSSKSSNLQVSVAYKF